jgi:hypothetical protein
MPDDDDGIVRALEAASVRAEQEVLRMIDEANQREPIEDFVVTITGDTTRLDEALNEMRQLAAVATLIPRPPGHPIPPLGVTRLHAEGCELGLHVGDCRGIPPRHLWDHYGYQPPEASAGWGPMRTGFGFVGGSAWVNGSSVFNFGNVG